jgi:hypothetical protein
MKEGGGEIKEYEEVNAILIGSLGRYALLHCQKGN